MTDMRNMQEHQSFTPEQTMRTLERIAQMPDERIDTGDIPELDDTFWENAKLTLPVHNLRLPRDVLDFFRKRNPNNYITDMKEVLTAHAETHR